MTWFARLCVTCAAFALAGVSVLAAPGNASARPISDFYGQYVGHSVNATGGEFTARDIDVTIKPVKSGFNVAWTTVTYKKSGNVTRRSYAIDFHATARDNVFRSAMRRDVFGGRTPNDPMKGDPYVWARVGGDTLTVYALIISEDGGYDMQVYKRTLTENGMRLEFSRFMEGREPKGITGELRRVPE